MGTSRDPWDWAEQAVVDYESSEGIHAVGRDELRRILARAFADALAQPDEEPAPEERRCAKCGEVIAFETTYLHYRGSDYHEACNPMGEEKRDGNV